MDTDEKARYYKITRTLFSMLRDRGNYDKLLTNLKDTLLLKK